MILAQLSRILTQGKCSQHGEQTKFKLANMILKVYAALANFRALLHACMHVHTCVYTRMHAYTNAYTCLQFSLDFHLWFTTQSSLTAGNKLCP